MFFNIYYSNSRKCNLRWAKNNIYLDLGYTGNIYNPLKTDLFCLMKPKYKVDIQLFGANEETEKVLQGDI